MLNTEHHAAAPQRPPLSAVIAGLAFVVIVALLAFATGEPLPADDPVRAAPEAQRVLEDWRGNSAGPERTRR